MPEPLLLTAGANAQPGSILHDLQQNMWLARAEQHVQEVIRIQRAYKNHYGFVQAHWQIGLYKSETRDSSGEGGRKARLVESVRSRQWKRCQLHSKQLHDAAGLAKHHTQVRNYYGHQIERLKGMYEKFWAKSEEADDE